MSTMTALAPTAADPLDAVRAAVMARAAARADADRARAAARAALAEADRARAAYLAAGRRLGLTVAHATDAGLRFADVAPAAGLTPQRLHRLARSA